MDDKGCKEFPLPCQVKDDINRELFLQNLQTHKCDEWKCSVWSSVEVACVHTPFPCWWFYNIENWLITLLSALYDKIGVTFEYCMWNIYIIKCKIFPVNPIKAYRGNGGTDSLILNLDTGWNWVVNFKFQLLYPAGNTFVNFFYFMFFIFVISSMSCSHFD